MNVSLSEIRSGFPGYVALIDLFHKIIELPKELLQIDMSNVSWIDANMCAPLGAVLSQHRGKGGIQLLNLHNDQKEIFQKNRFLKNFGFTNVPLKTDVFRTTIEYKEFDALDSAAFKEYVATHFRGKNKGIPDMSEALQKKFRESIFEIFENALFHSETKLGIFACGQYFPKKNRLDFTIADRGIGIRRNILEKLNVPFSPEMAIHWAMSENNTTKRVEDGRPGGIGLKLIKDFINLNKGRLTIVSDAGFWDFFRGNINKRQMGKPFPGTIVNIEINTADRQSYRLTSEIDPNRIF